MKKSFEGLGAIVQSLFPGELLTGAYFIFLSRRRDRMKVLFWDSDGFVIFYKLLEKGTFSKKWNDKTQLDRKTFFMLLEGISPKKIDKRFSLF